MAGLTKHTFAPSSTAPVHPCASGSSKKRLTDAEIATLCASAGFPQKDGGIPKPNLPDLAFPGSSNPLVVAVAVVLAESGGKLCSKNTNTNGSHDRGIFQINDHAHPDVSDDCAYNPFCAAPKALAISSGGTNWTPWSAYNSRAYAVFLPRALSAVKKTPAGTTTLDNTLAGAGNVAAGIGDLASAVPRFLGLLTQGSTWLRVGFFVGGGALALMAVRGLARKFDMPQLATAADAVVTAPKKLANAAGKVGKYSQKG